VPGLPLPPMLFPCSPPPQDSKKVENASRHNATKTRRDFLVFVINPQMGRKKTEAMVASAARTGAVVEMARLTRVSPLPAATCCGEKRQEERAGNPEQVKVASAGKVEVVGATSTMN
jgi:hypothetical protein